MVILSAALIANRKPRAHIAMLRWIGVGFGVELPRLLELPSHLAEISDVTLNLEGFWIGSPTQHYVHPLRLRALNPRQQVRIEAKLNQSGRLGGSGELCFHDLVRPLPKFAGLVHSDEEVRPAAP